MANSKANSFFIIKSFRSEFFFFTVVRSKNHAESPDALISRRLACLDGLVSPASTLFCCPANKKGTWYLLAIYL